MWGNWMDKATALAANLDKQLNESVGMDGDPSATTASSASSVQASSTLLSAAVIPEHSATEGGVTGGGGDAWNDDFDFDDEDDNAQEKIAASAEPVKETTIPESAPIVPPPAPSVSVAKLSSPVVQTKASSSPMAASFAPAPPPTTTEPVEEDVAAPTTTSGWDAGDEDLDLTETNDGNLDEIEMDDVVTDTTPTKSEEPPAVQVATTPTSPLATPAMASSPPPPSPNKSMSSTSPASPPKPPMSPLRNNPAAAFVASNVFSTFAHKAESLAHKAESLVHLRGDDGKPTHSIPNPLAPVSSLLSSFGGGAVVAKPPVESSTQQALEESANGAWAEEDGDALELDIDEDEAKDIPVGSPASPTTPTEPTAVVEDEPAVAQEKVVPSTTTTTSSSVDGPAATPAPALEPTPAAEMNKDEFIMLPVESQKEPVPETPVPTTSAPSTTTFANIEDDPRYQQLVQQLRLREDQLSSKSMQMTQLQELMEQQERELKQKLADTKEEAKKRILRAKERCEAAEARVQELQSATTSDSASQAQLIQALREEGEKLAHKQSAMEQAVRAAKLECRDLSERLETEQEAKTKALEKIAKLESDLKMTKEFLSAARKGESQAGKLEQDLLSARSDAEMKAATILSLQQQIKELTAEGKELQEELKRTRKEAEQAAQQEKKTLRREHHDIINDLETKLRTTEREAGVREDALRHEVSELRKRWQDAVRRADALSMDVQSSTAPLLRQLESTERQNRARAANWAELENRLRSELEETVIQNENMSKERSEFKTKCARLERSMIEQEQELKQAKRVIEEQTAKITKLEAQLEEMEAQAQKREEEYVKVERLANEGVMRVRSEMTQTVVDSEERYRGQIDKLENELRVENEKRSQLEKQVQQLLENAGMIVAAPQAPEAIRREAKPKKLRQAEGQAEILAGALGFESDTDDDDDEESLGQPHPMDRGDLSAPRSNSGGMTSFAALEQLTSRLKAAKIELEALRNNLRESERVRESLVEELGESRTAKEKLPLFEAKVKELTQDNREKELEIQGLREDIADVREMYRTQLNVLLEEKAAQLSPPLANGSSERTAPAATLEMVQKSD